METFDFKHEYYKLRKRVMTTVRGKGHAAKLMTDDVVNLSFRGDIFGQAKVTKFKVMRVGDIPFELMKQDVEYPGFVINDCWGFINLINSFRKFTKSHIKTLDDEVCVIKLERILKDNK